MVMRIFIWTGLILIIPLSLNAQNERAMARKGNEAYQAGNYSKAEVNYKKSLKNAKDFNEAQFNLGNALVRQERYKQAAKEYTKVTQSTDKRSIKAKAYHNKGNAYLNAKKYHKSVKAYKNALRNDPGDKDARYNLSYALKKLKKQQQKQKKQNKNKQQKNQNKDNQKKNKEQQNKKNQDQKGDKQKQRKSKQNQDKQNKQQQQKQDKGDQKDAQQKKAQKSGEKKPKMGKQEMMRMLKAIESSEEEIQRKILKKKRKGQPSDDIQKNW